MVDPNSKSWAPSQLQDTDKKSLLAKNKDILNKETKAYLDASPAVQKITF